MNSFSDLFKETESELHLPSESEQKTCELASALGGFQYLAGHEFRQLAFQTNSK